MSPYSKRLRKRRRIIDGLVRDMRSRGHNVRVRHNLHVSHWTDGDTVVACSVYIDCNECFQESSRVVFDTIIDKFGNRRYTRYADPNTQNCDHAMRSLLDDILEGREGPNTFFTTLAKVYDKQQ